MKLVVGEEPISQSGQRVAAGFIAAGLGAVVILGLVTGDISSSRHPELQRASDPFYFWAYMALIAGSAVYAAALASGYVKIEVPANYVERMQRKTITSFTLLPLLGAAGCGWFWLTETLDGRSNPIVDIAGGIAIAMLGLATLPPYLSPGPARAAIRTAGIVAIIVAVTMIVRSVW